MASNSQRWANLTDHLLMRRDSQALSSVASERHSLLKHISPERVLIYGLMAWAIVFALSPVTVTIDFTWMPIFFLVGGYVTLLLGMQSVGARPSLKSPTMDRGLLKALLIATVIIGSAGMALKQYDLYSIRGADIAQNVVEEGKEIANAGSNQVSAIAAVFYPCCYLVLFLYLAYTEGRKRDWRAHGLALLLTLLPGINGILLGSRSRLLVTAALVFVYYIYFGVLKLNSRSIFTGAVAAITLSTIFSLVFLNRLSSMRIDPTVSVYQSAYAFTVRPNRWADAALAGTGVSYYIAFSSLMLTQYFIHGFLEFVYMFQNFQGPHTWGGYTFGIYSKAVAMVLGGQDTTEKVLSVIPRSGVFTSFFGSTYIDFGWFSVIYLFGLGAGIKLLWYRALQRDYSLAPLYCYSTVILFFAPLTNFIFGAEGLYGITTMILYWAIVAFNRKGSRG